MSYKASFWRWSLSSLLLLLLLLTACGGESNQAQPTPTQNPALERVPYDLGLPDEAKKAPSVGDVPGDTQLKLNITFKTDDKVIQDITGKDGKIKDGDQIDISKKANELGITDQEYEQIKQFFGVQDAKLKLGKLHTYLTVEAKAASIASLLQTKLVYKELNGRKFYMPEKDPMLPKFVFERIVSVTGLETYSQAPQKSLSLTPLTARQPQLDCKAKDDWVTPQEVAKAYGFDHLYDKGWTGKGMTILLPEFETYDKEAVERYGQCVGYKGKIDVVNVGLPPIEVGGEATLDIEMIQGLAPEANIVVYQAINTPFSMEWVLNQILDDYADAKKPAVISLSWGNAEHDKATSSVRAVAESIKLLTQARYMTVFVASGDCGAYGGGVYKELAVDFPSSVPWSVGVGGTKLSTGLLGRMNEAVWSDGSNTSECKNTWGSGGGVSTLFKRPEWQKGDGVQNEYSNGNRQVPDVSAVAIDLPIIFQGAWYSVGGTSAATPIWATGFSLLNQGLIAETGYYYYGPDTFYKASENRGLLTNPFFDVKEGDNLYYKAGAGWDYPTGLGTPNYLDLYLILKGTIQEESQS
ncbi:kumamolisin [Thermosporothrix hazakensis]|jgi:kumamolisin|uniref:Kumamolisin n=2 Tax=Thermosporothrix TaxID=768650 RepID=A0A326U613_THEHA|nr:S53 family peptidase [Thermosporothrix hazakensis]PZW27472.1 kumamolisin [Thermosporothrix hazakensis]BBH85935.1 hypothetical protein KTC_06860 [Thermosporothrix sp. COM3]GCE45638.1 hypothetical protein KTH_05070 [Thermosporothrix hazakensis]